MLREWWLSARLELRGRVRPGDGCSGALEIQVVPEATVLNQIMLEGACNDRSGPNPRASGVLTFRSWNEEEEPKKQSENGQKKR